MTDKNKFVIGTSLLILSVLLVSSGTGYIAGVGGALISGGVMSAIYGGCILSKLS